MLVRVLLKVDTQVKPTEEAFPIHRPPGGPKMDLEEHDRAVCVQLEELYSHLCPAQEAARSVHLTYLAQAMVRAAKAPA